MTVSLTEAQQRAERLEAAIREALDCEWGCSAAKGVRRILTNALKGEQE